MQVETVDFKSPNAAEAFDRSFRHTGFVVFHNHDIDANFLTDFYQQWHDFFHSEEKYRYQYDLQPNRHDGYFPFLSENAKDSAVKDLKEFFHYYAWGICPAHLKSDADKLYQSLTFMAAKILQMLQTCLPAEVTDQLSMPLEQMIAETPNNLMRILNYPPLDDSVADGAVRAAAHGDINLITLLVTATEPGLEVMDTAENWHPVACNPGNIAVNAGDMLEMATNHYYPSTLHRVVNPPQTEKSKNRMSIPFFCHPNDHVRLSAKHTASSYLNERLREIGLKT